MFHKVPSCLKVVQGVQKRTGFHKRYLRLLSLVPSLLNSSKRKLRVTGLLKYRCRQSLVSVIEYQGAIDSNKEVFSQIIKPEISNDIIALQNQDMSSKELSEKEVRRKSTQNKRSGNKKKRKDASINSATPRISAVPPDASVMQNSPIEKYMDAFLTPTSNHVDAAKGSKDSKSKSHKRNYHSETTPSKGALPKMNCSEYWPLGRVEEGIKDGKVVTGSFRISTGNYNNAYISAPGDQRDVLIEGSSHRNRAFHGDVVAVEILDENEPLKREVEEIARKLALEFNNMQITEDNLNKTNQLRGRVVHILERKHCRKAAGMLKQYKNNSYGFALMSPQDSRLPRVMISLTDCPKDFMSRPQDFQNVLFTAEITDWKRTNAMATGKLIKELGGIGEIEPETEGFLTEYNIDDSPFPEEALACLPTDLPWKIPEDEYSKRKDLRKECIFTIDPATARDLDDALSIKQMPDGNFEVGVHIADVSYFIEEGNDLDKVAASRATSVYLVQRVVPMLPRLLCEHLCSLNPGDDKLTFSVIWTITPDGKVLDEWFGRSVIRSCTKLSYDHAQQMIETEEPASLDWTQFPEIDASHSLTDIHRCVRHLYDLSVFLRRKRFDAGALALNQPKLSFTLDQETGMPNGFGSFVARDSNRLVEEFMLLANMAVAHRLVRSLPEHAFLRRHPVPHPKMVEDLLTLCKRCEVGIAAETSKSLNASLESLKNSNIPDKEAIYFAVVSLCSKPMQLAKYFCAGAIEDPDQYRHYALSVPLYTHFTSPIRRYPDVIVHRMLTAALQDEGAVLSSVQELQQLAEHCNDKKSSAKKVQELSTLLFFNAYIRELGELRETAVIIGILDSALDVLLLHSGIVKRIYCNSLPLHKWKASKESKDTMKVYWKDKADDDIASSVGNEASCTKQKDSKPEAPKSGDDENDDKDLGQEQVFHIFDRIDVLLKAEKKDQSPYRVNAYLPRPEY